MTRGPAMVVRAILLAALFWVQALAASAQDLRYLGSFHNVSSGDGGDHCEGYSLGLWKFRDHLLGLLDVHAGLCGDPACGAIRDAVLEGSTDRLRFSSSIGWQKIEFDGSLTDGAVEGDVQRKASPTRARPQRAERRSQVQPQPHGLVRVLGLGSKMRRSPGSVPVPPGSGCAESRGFPKADRGRGALGVQRRIHTGLLRPLSRQLAGVPCARARTRRAAKSAPRSREAGGRVTPERSLVTSGPEARTRIEEVIATWRFQATTPDGAPIRVRIKIRVYAE